MDLNYGNVFFFGITKLEEKKIHHSLYRHEGLSIHHWSDIRHISSHARIKKILSGVGAKSNTGFLACCKMTYDNFFWYVYKSDTYNQGPNHTFSRNIILNFTRRKLNLWEIIPTPISLGAGKNIGKIFENAPIKILKTGVKSFFFFNSPRLKAYVIFSNQFCAAFICLLKFSTSSPEQRSQLFQPNLSLRFIQWMENKSHVLL